MSDLAKVGDVIEYGQDIPPNVVRFTDAQRQPGYFWARTTIDPLRFDYRCPGAVPLKGLLVKDLEEQWWPMTVVEVDPEPQPAWTGFVHAFLPGSDDCCNALLATGSPRLTGKVRCGNVQDAPCHLGSSFEQQPAESGPLLGLATTRQLLEELKARRITAPSAGERQRLEDAAGGLLKYLTPATLGYRTAEPRTTSGPLVLTLPQVPDGAVALVGLRTGTRYEPEEEVWRINSWYGDLPDVLRREHPEGARVEMAPPREPRTWPKIDKPDDDDLPQVIDVEGHGRWRRCSVDGVLFTDGESGTTMGELMTWGDVREVLDNG